MPIDASIPLQGAQQAQPNLIQQATQAFTLKSAMQQSQQVEQTQKDQALLKQVLSDPAGFDVDQSTGIPIPKPETMQKLYGISPTAAQKLGESTMKLKADQQRQQQQKQQMAKAYADEAGPVLATLATEYEKAPGTPEEKWAAIKPKMDAANAEFGQKAQQYGLPFKPIESAEQLQTKASAWSKYAERQMRATQPDTPHEQRMGKASERRAAAAESAAKNKGAATPGEEPKPSLSSTAIDTEGFDYLLNKKLPPNLARSFKGQTGPDSKAIINRAAQWQEELGLTPQDVAVLQANNKALAPAMAQMQKQKNAIEAFERTLQTNAAAGLDLSKKVWRSGSQWLNKPLIDIMEKGAGDPDVSRLRVRTESIVQEVGKIMSGSMGNAPLAQAQAEHARQLLNLVQSPQQYEAAIKEIQDEVEKGRVEGMRKQMKQMISEMLPGGSKPGGPNAPNPGGSGASGGGKRWVFDPATGALKPSDGASGATDPAKAVPQ